MNIFKINKIMNLILVIAIAYACISFFNQQLKLNEYNKSISYYNAQIKELEEKRKELLSTQANVNSPEYIEKVARENLEMYLPNETVYVVSNK